MQHAINCFLRQVAHEFQLGDYLDHEPMTGGGASIFKLHTSRGTFVVKRSTLEQELLLYKQIETVLNQADVKQALLHTTSTGSFVSSTGYTVFEVLRGFWTIHPTLAQSAALMNYFADYNLALRSIPAPYFLKELYNVWQKANSLDYISLCVPQYLTHMSVSPIFKNTIAFALSFLTDVRQDLDRLPKQLIHGDVGPGNILYVGNQVVSIIDFTPFYESHVYSLCVSFYWHYGYYNNNQIDVMRIKDDLATYSQKYPFSDEEKQLFYAIFIKVATRILVVRLLLYVEEGQTLSNLECDRRAKILNEIIANRSTLEIAITGN